MQFVHCREVVHYSECPLSEVPLITNIAIYLHYFWTGPRSVDTTESRVKPKLSELSNELRELTWSDIESLAVQLEVDFHELLRIQEQTDQPTNRMHRALNIWLEKDTSASWEKVINALDRVKGKDVLVRRLKEKYIPQSPGNFTI